MHQIHSGTEVSRVGGEEKEGDVREGGVGRKRRESV